MIRLSPLRFSDKAEVRSEGLTPEAADKNHHIPSDGCS